MCLFPARPSAVHGDRIRGARLQWRGELRPTAPLYAGQRSWETATVPVEKPAATSGIGGTSHATVVATMPREPARHRLPVQLRRHQALAMLLRHATGQSSAVTIVRLSANRAYGTAPDMSANKDAECMEYLRTIGRSLA